MRDYRNRLIQYKDGQRIFHKPSKPIEKCFEVKDVTWWIIVADKKGKEHELIFYSGYNERSFRSENKDTFIF